MLGMERRKDMERTSALWTNVHMLYGFHDEHVCLLDALEHLDTSTMVGG